MLNVYMGVGVCVDEYFLIVYFKLSQYFVQKHYLSIFSLSGTFFFLWQSKHRLKVISIILACHFTLFHTQTSKNLACCCFFSQIQIWQIFIEWQAKFPAHSKCSLSILWMNSTGSANKNVAYDAISLWLEQKKVPNSPCLSFTQELFQWFNLLSFLSVSA